MLCWSYPTLFMVLALVTLWIDGRPAARSSAAITSSVQAAMPYSPGSYRALLDVLQAPFGGDRATASTTGADFTSSSLASTKTGSGITYDAHSVFIAGRRVFLFSAEFHPWRLPVPGLWRDVLYKIKEAGFNVVSIYLHWGLISPSPLEVDLKGINDLGLFLDMAKEVGLLVNVRCGPYINAETTNGGMPGWVQGLPVVLRTNGTAFTMAWKPYIRAVAKVISRYQLKSRIQGKTQDVDPTSGPVILVQLENEYSEDAKTAAYVTELSQTLQEEGVDRALFSYNEASALHPAPSFSKIVDLYGVDAYPQGFDCRKPHLWRPVEDQYGSALHRLNLSVPKALWEFQAGSFDPFGGAGYHRCYQLTNERFARVFNHVNLAQGFKILSQYMVYGGTNWGHLLEPTVYTSYDYGAAVSEDRQIRGKAREYSLLAGFLRASPDFTTATAAAVARGSPLTVLNQTGGAAKIYTMRPLDESSDARWYIARQNHSTSTAPSTFKLKVDVAGRSKVIPEHDRIVLDGRDSKIISTNHRFQSGLVMLYSTAGLSFASVIGRRDIIALHGDAEQTLEARFELPRATSSYDVVVHPPEAIVVSHDRQQVRLNWTTRRARAVHVQLKWDDYEALVILAETKYAYLTRPLSLSVPGSLGSILMDEDVTLVSGGYHLAKARLEGKTLRLYGQANATAVLDILTSNRPDAVTFNEEAILIDAEPSSYGSIRAYLPGPSEEAQSYEPPKLDCWSFADSLPEMQANYNDDDWVRAYKTSTYNAYYYLPQVSTNGHVLFSDEYGFHAGHIIWRGRFHGTGKETRFTIRLQGGSYFAGSLWLNGVHLGSAAGNAAHSDGNITASIKGVVKEGENILTVLHDSNGLEEAMDARILGAGNDSPTTFNASQLLPQGAKFPLEGSKTPRGILSYSFAGSHGTKIDDWRVQGNYKGEQCPDRVRKCLNEGGLHAEVQGWHLPGFDASDWPVLLEDSPPTIPTAGIRFFLTNITLDVPLGHDLPMSIVFPDVDEDDQETYRAQLYVNGWQFGKRLAGPGPQTVFPVPPGVLLPRGVNTIGLALWSLKGQATMTGGVQLKVMGRYRGEVTYDIDEAPGWSASRTTTG